MFAGKRIAIVYDCDKAGRDGARKVFESVRLWAPETRVVDLDPGENKGLDVTDVLRDHGEKELRRRIRAAEVHRPPLRIERIADVIDRLDAAPDPAWLFKPVFTSDAYGVLGAIEKAGKTWALADAAVSVASGTPWMGAFEVERPGGVLLFAGEGGERKLRRRLEAICESRDLDLRDLDIRICFRAPNLSDAEHVALIARTLETDPAVFVGIEPLYLSLGANVRSADMFNMGPLLRPAQEVAQDAGAALMLTHHFNQSGKGGGFDRLSGAGVAAWARIMVLGTLDERTSRTEPSGATVANVTWMFVGDEIPTTTALMTRRVWAEDPSDLASPLHYEVSVRTDGIVLPKMSPAVALVVGALNGPDERPLSTKTIWKRLNQELDRRTVEKALAALKRQGLAASIKREGVNRWFRTT